MFVATGKSQVMSHFNSRADHHIDHISNPSNGYPPVAILALKELLKNTDNFETKIKPLLNWRGPPDWASMVEQPLDKHAEIIQMYQKMRRNKKRKKLQAEQKSIKVSEGYFGQADNMDIDDDNIEDIDALIESSPDDEYDSVSLKKFLAEIMNKENVNDITSGLIEKFKRGSKLNELSKRSQDQLTEAIVNLMVGLNISERRVVNKHTLAQFIQVFSDFFIICYV